MAMMVPYDQKDAPPRNLELTIVAQDPSVKDADGKVLRATVRIPADRLEPGPRGPRLHVIDYDATTRTLVEPPIDLAPPPIRRGWEVLDRMAVASDDDLGTPECRAQNVYAIAARTLASFEFGLGRPVPWAFGGHSLYVVPAAFAEANAYYADDDQALYFGYFKPTRDAAPIYTSLSHDIVAHETTHAILDGLRRRFDVPGLPDQLAFHEGFADIVALLSVFSTKEVVANLLGKPGSPRLRVEDVSESALKAGPLFQLGEQLGTALYEGRRTGLRNSVNLEPPSEWATLPEWEEPHRRGEILVAAVTQSLVLLWTRRLKDLDQNGTLDRKRVAEEGARAARHLLEMMIRAIDYCPPVEFEFVDFLDAVLASDKEVAPDDDLNYRDLLKEAFAGFGIYAQEPQSVVVEEAEQPKYQNFHFTALQSDHDEVYRFIWTHAEFLDIDRRFYLNVESVRPSTRIGPDGFVVTETVADYVQELIGTPEELRALAGRDFARNVPGDAAIKLFGGGTVIFDQFGKVKYHQTKPLGDWTRQQARIDFLVRQGAWSRKGQLGFSYGTSLGQRFAQLHRPGDDQGERW